MIGLDAPLLMQMLAAGVVQLGWAVMAPSQVQPGAAHASALLESEQSDLDNKEDGPGRAPIKKQLWRNYGRDQMMYCTWATENCTSWGYAVREGHFVQVLAALQQPNSRACRAVLFASCCHEEPCVPV